MEKIGGVNLFSHDNYYLFNDNRINFKLVFSNKN